MNTEKVIESKWMMVIKHEQITKFMRACDMCEEFKIFGQISCYNMNLTIEDETIFRETLMLKLLSSFNHIKNEDIIFAHVKSISYNNKVILNKRYSPYIKGGISVVSDGNKWSLLKDIIEQALVGTEITFKVDQHNRPLPNKILNYVYGTF